MHAAGRPAGMPAGRHAGRKARTQAGRQEAGRQARRKAGRQARRASSKEYCTQAGRQRHARTVPQVAAVGGSLGLVHHDAGGVGLVGQLHDVGVRLGVDAAAVALALVTGVEFVVWVVT